MADFSADRVIVTKFLFKTCGMNRLNYNAVEAFKHCAEVAILSHRSTASSTVHGSDDDRETDYIIIIIIIILLFI